MRKDMEIFRKAIGKLEEEKKELTGRLSQQRNDYESQIEALKV